MTRTTTEEHSEELRLIVWIIFLAFSVAVVAFLVYGYVTFHRLRSLIVIGKRYPSLVLFQAVATVIAVLIFDLLFMTEATHLFPQSSRDKLYRIAFVFYPSGHLVFVCEICRLWLMGFDIHYSINLQAVSWKSQIDSRIAAENWWIRKHATFGNSTYVSRRLLFCGFLLGLGIGIAAQITPRNRWIRLVDACFYLVETFSLLYIYCKCPTVVDDKTFFRSEFKLISIVWITGVSCYCIAPIIDSYDEFFADLAGSIVGQCTLVSMSLVSTLWIPAKILGETEWLLQFERDQQGSQQVSGQSVSDISHRAPSLSTRPSETRSEALVTTFRDHTSLDAFAVHMIQEMSLECLLSFIEMMQFKQYIYQLCYNEHGASIQLGTLAIEFDFGPDGLHSDVVSSVSPSELELKLQSQTDAVGPKCDDSEDVQESNEPKLKHLKRIAYLLYQKYIAQHAVTQVNISSECRGKYDALMAQETKWTNDTEVSAELLLVLFDDVCLEMFQLMSYSLSRFKK